MGQLFGCGHERQLDFRCRQIQRLVLGLALCTKARRLVRDRLLSFSIDTIIRGDVVRNLVIVAVILGLCGCNGRNPMAPTVVTGNKTFVTVYDAWGISGESLKVAENYCAPLSAQYQGKGGDAFECSGNDYCTTYICR